MTARLLSLALAGAALAGGLALSPRSHSAPTRDKRPAATKAAPVRLARLPLVFEENRGQTDRQARFLARGGDHTLFLTPTEAVLTLHGKSEVRSRKSDVPGRSHRQSSSAPAATPKHRSTETPNRSAALRMRLVGARPAPTVTGECRLPGVSHYMTGSDPAKWRRNIPQYAQVRYTGVYPGIDLVYHGRQGALEYDFVVAPGADPNRIRLSLAGAERAHMDECGDLLLATAAGEVRQHKPVCYQDVGGRRVPVSGAYALADPRAESPSHPITPQVSFRLGAYDRTKPLIIDPVLTYSSYFGGPSGDGINSVSLDAGGNVYVCGSTASVNFPLTGPAQEVYGGGATDGLVAKLDPTGSTVLYATYLGGGGIDRAVKVAVGSDGEACVTGLTNSTNFPTSSPAQSAYGGGSLDAFVTRLSGDGSRLLFSTYLGGGSEDRGAGIAVDSTSNVWIAGTTWSSNFPTKNRLQPRGGYSDVFLTRLAANGGALLFSTYFGRSSGEQAADLALDVLGCPYITGTGSVPLTNPIPPSSGGSGGAFVSKFAADGSSVFYSTNFGGSPESYSFSIYPSAIAVDTSGGAYVTGYIRWGYTSMYVRKARQARHGGGDSDAFVTKITPGGTSIAYSSYLGGEANDWGYGIAVDGAGSAYVVGATDSEAFPRKEPVYEDRGYTDAFLSRFEPYSAQLIYSTYLGGSGNESASGIAVAPSGSVWIAGSTSSADFPLEQPFQPTLSGGTDAFLSRVHGLDPPLRQRWTEAPASPIVSLRAEWLRPPYEGAGLDYYRIQVKEDSRSFSSGPYLIDMVLPNTALRKTFTDAHGLRAGHSYAFRIKAVDTSGNESPWSPVSAPAAVAMGSFSGVVTRADGTPIPGAVVQALPHGGTGVERTVAADTLGRYLLPALPAGLHDIRVIHSEYVTTTFTNGGNGYPLAGNQARTLNLSVSRLRVASLYGYITRADSGALLGGVTVRAYRWRTTNLLGTTTTAYNGLFIFPRMAPGVFRLEFSAEGFSPAASDAITAVDGLRSGVSIALAPNGTTPPSPSAGSISGRVTLGDATPIVNAVVTISQEYAGTVVKTVRTDVQGYYVAPSLAPSVYSIRCSKEGSPARYAGAGVRAGGDTERVFRLGYYATLTGFVTADGYPANGLRVTASTNRASYSTWVGADGRYRLVMPPEYSYEVVSQYDGTLVKNVQVQTQARLDFEF